MKSPNRYLLLTIITIASLSFSQCASTYKLQETTPMVFGQVYYQSWVAGVKGGGSGVNLYIPIEKNPKNMVLDSVYYKSKRLALEQANPNLYVGRIRNIANQKPDIIMSNEPYAEYGNSVPQIQYSIPFELKDDECVLVYTEGENQKYYKLTGIIKKEPLLYPGTPPKKL